jgi:DNA-binding LacI/PurR family transcriptional regulator
MAKSEVFGNPTKLQRACEQLSIMVRQKEPGAKLPTGMELCRMLGVGLNTLHEALGELENHHLIERRHGVGIFVAPRREKTIALICDPTILQSADISPFWQMLIERCQARAALVDETLEFHFTGFQNKSDAPFNQSLTRDFQQHRIDGAIGIGLEFDVMKWIEQHKVPYVAYAGYGLHIDTPSLIELGVQELHKRKCRRIGFWVPATPKRPVIPVEEKLEVIAASLKRHGLDIYPDLIWHGLQHQSTQIQKSHQEQGFCAAMETFSKPRTEWPDGLLITDDMMAHGALIAMENLKPDIRARIPIATHSNKGSTVLHGRKNLILLETDLAEIVNAIFETLEKLMLGKTPSSSVALVKPILKYAP